MTHQETPENGMHDALTCQADYFNALAREGIWESFLPEETEKIQKFIRLWDIQSGATLFEPGCGAGRLTQELAATVGEDGRVVACDIAPEMVKRARNRRYSAAVSVHCCSLTEVPCTPHSFDRIICFNVFPHFHDREHILRSLKEMLAPGGRLWICHNRGREAINRIHAEGGEQIRGHQLPLVNDLEALLAKAGFHVLDSCDTPDEYWVTAHA